MDFFQEVLNLIKMHLTHDLSSKSFQKFCICNNKYKLILADERSKETQAGATCYMSISLHQMTPQIY